MKDRVVLFQDNQTRILVGANVSNYSNNPNAVVNPDLSSLRGVPPHYWKNQNGEIVEMSAEEKSVADKSFSNSIQPKTIPTRSFTFLKGFLAGFAVAGSLALLVHVLF